MESHGQAQHDEDSGSDLLDPILRDPLGVLVRRWKSMLLVALTSMLVAIAVIPTATARLEFSTDNLHVDGQTHDLRLDSLGSAELHVPDGTYEIGLVYQPDEEPMAS